MTNTEIAREWFDKVWNERDEASIDRLLSEDVKLCGLGAEELGREDFRQLYKHLLKKVPDIAIEVTHTIEQGDWVALRAVVTGTDSDSGQTVHFHGLSMARFVDGKAVETCEAWDFLTLLVQTGAVPTEALAALDPGAA